MLLELQLNDRRSAWEMQPDGSYVQRRPVAEDDQCSCPGAADRAGNPRNEDPSRRGAAKARDSAGATCVN